MLTEKYVLHMQVLLEYCCIYMENSIWENLNNIFCRNVSFFTGTHCDYGVYILGMKQT